MPRYDADAYTRARQVRRDTADRYVALLEESKTRKLTPEEKRELEDLKFTLHQCRAQIGGWG
jgi:hypothetical protein